MQNKRLEGVGLPKVRMMNWGIFAGNLLPTDRQLVMQDWVNRQEYPAHIQAFSTWTDYRTLSVVCAWDEIARLERELKLLKSENSAMNDKLDRMVNKAMHP